MFVSLATEVTTLKTSVPSALFGVYNATVTLQNGQATNATTLNVCDDAAVIQIGLADNVTQTSSFVGYTGWHFYIEVSSYSRFSFVNCMFT